MKKNSCLFLGFLTILGVYAQPKAEQEAIKNLCGCYEVDFKYAETFAVDTSYTFHPRYHVSGLEWVVAEEATDKKMVLQHLLIINDSTIIKHWREDWEFEKNYWLQYQQDKIWKHTNADAQKLKGQWTQTVWEVDDAPRYQGTGNWVSSNRKYFWENTTDAPLPRREYTKRNDYNIMQRTNRIIITQTGWIHEQDNKKLIRKDSAEDVFLTEEKGYNTYTKTNDSKCKQAEIWWQQHKQFWGIVRQSWEAIIKDKNTIRLTTKVDGKLLFQQLDILEGQKLSVKNLEEKVKTALAKYVTE